jgi:hypothetical protein
MKSNMHSKLPVFFAVLTVAAVTPSLAFAYDLVAAGQLVIDLINGVLVPVLFAVAFITFIYGVANTYILHPDKAEEGHKLILWGIIGFVVMVSLWGLVNVISDTLQLSGDAVELPQVQFK